MQREAKEKNRNDQNPASEPAASQPGQSQSQPPHDYQESQEDKTSLITPAPNSNTATPNVQTRPLIADPASKHKKTRSEVAREATFASLQRALNAAVAAREQFSPDSEGVLHAQNELLHDVSSVNSTSQTAMNPSLSEWGSSRDSSIAWTPSQSPENSYEFGSLNAMQFAGTDASLLVNKLEEVAHQIGFQGSHQPPLWDEQTSGLVEEHRLSEDLYGSLTFPSMAEPARRGSIEEELAGSHASLTVNSAGPTRQAAAQPGRLDGPVWRRPEKELDLAARRKRPRPAAIGTAIPSRTLGGAPSSMSPTTRMASFGGSQPLRHAKSSHALGSRYAGVRKFSAPQRSPLGFSTFSEAALTSTAGNVDVKRRLQTSASAGNLAPPTPLTPEDLQNLLPENAHDGRFQLPIQGVTTDQPLSVTQALQLSVESPPETPLTLEMISQFQNQHLVPPSSAPAQYANFPDYITCSSGPITGGSWADFSTLPSPDKASFPSNVQMPQPTYISPIAYGQDLNQSHHFSSQWPLTTDDPTIYPPPLKTSMTPSTTIGGADDQKVTEFLIHEFPEQQAAHRSVAQQLPPQRPKNYTFTNATPSDF